MSLKWGIATAGHISHDFVTAVATLPSNDHQIVAIAASDLERAKKFADLHGIAKAYKGYELLAQDQNVEVVYVGNIHPQHYEVTKMMLEHGKHVLCEKPLCMNEKQAKKLIDFAKSKKLFLMEGIWSRFFPVYQYLNEVIQSGALGEIHTITAELGGKRDDVDRVITNKLGGGTILNTGIYTIQFAQFIFNQFPISIKATGELNIDGCDLNMKAELLYNNGKVAHIATNAKQSLSNLAVVRGTKGEIKLNDFWCPVTLIDVDGTEKSFPLPQAKHEFNFKNSCGLRYEAEEVRKCIRANLLECSIVSHNESLIIARIEDEIRKQIGVIYDDDKE